MRSISLSAPVVSIKEKPGFSVECEGVKRFAGRSTASEIMVVKDGKQVGQRSLSLIPV